MATIKKKLSLKIAELFPGFVGSDQAGVITFLEKYYEFLESAELKLTSVSTVDRLLQEEGSTNFVIYNNESERTETSRKEDRVVLEENTKTAFVNAETITGSTSKATATIRVEDINANSRLFISSQNLFVIGETVTGATSGASGTISSYRANPVENIVQLMEYADIDNTVDSFFDEFKAEFLRTLPTTLASGVNKRKLLKSIKDLYRAKGTRKAHELFFRLLLDENVEVYYPTVDMLRVSDGNWDDSTILRLVEDNDVIEFESGNAGEWYDDNGDLLPNASFIDGIYVEYDYSPYLNTEVGSGNVYLTMEDGSHIEKEDSSFPSVTFANLVGQTITQAAVRDTTIELGGTYASEGFSAIEEATAQVESISKYQFGNVVTYELVLSDGQTSGTFVTGQNISGTDSVNTDLTINAKIAGVLTDSSITSSSQYYALGDPLTITADNGTTGSASIESLSACLITEIIASAAGSGYVIDDEITVSNTGTSGTGLAAKVSIVNGGIAPETGSLIEQFRFTGEQTSDYNENMALEDGDLLLEETSGDNLLSETDTAFAEMITEDTTALYFTQEEDYGMASTDHFVLETETLAGSSFSGNKVVQEIGSGTGDITDIRVTSLGENYTSLPTLTLPTTSPRTGGVVIPKGTNVGKIASIRIDNPGVHYTDTPTLSAQTNFLVTGVTGTFTSLETITGGTSAKTATFKSMDTDTGVMKVSSPSGTFTTTETLTGGTSGATAVLNSYTAPSITATIGTTTTKAGEYTNQDGHLSESSKKIQDSYYYQDYSYVIKASKAIVDWRSDLYTSVHPAGWQVFGQIDAVSAINVQIRTASTSPEAQTVRATYTPELFSLFHNIFTTKLGRRLGGAAYSDNIQQEGLTGDGSYFLDETDSDKLITELLQTYNTNPLVGVGRNTALENQKEVQMVTIVTYEMIWWTAADTADPLGNTTDNVEDWRYSNTESEVFRIELEDYQEQFALEDATADAGDLLLEETAGDNMLTEILFGYEVQEASTTNGYVPQGRDYIIGDAWQVHRTHLGYYEKRLSTTLDGAHNASVTTIALTSTTGFPSKGIIQIGNEHILYTGVSSNNLTGCTRGYDVQGSTDAASHSDDVNVYNLQFISSKDATYRIQDVGEAVINEVNAGTRFHVAPPSEITISYT